MSLIDENNKALLLSLLKNNILYKKNESYFYKIFEDVVNTIHGDRFNFNCNTMLMNKEVLKIFSNLEKKNQKSNNKKIEMIYNKNDLFDRRLDDKQKGICMQAFAEYAHNMTKAQAKSRKAAPSSPEQKPGKVDKKELNQYMLRFSEKRDRAVRECLKRRQIEKYNKLIKNVHPLTLNLRSEKK